MEERKTNIKTWAKTGLITKTTALIVLGTFVLLSGFDPRSSVVDSKPGA